MLYFILLRTEKRFILNRMLLLASLFIAFTIPAIEIDISFGTVAPLQYTGIDGFQDYFAFDIATNNQFAYNANRSINWLAIYFTGLTIVLLYQLVNIIKLWRIKSNSFVFRSSRIRLISSSEHIQPFSFGKWIYLHKNELNNPNIKTIIAHEKNHLISFHSIDMVIMEIVSAILWFNPFVILHKRMLREVHEYQADHKTVQKNGSLISFLESIKWELTKYNLPYPGHSFYSLTIKKRIKMMTKNKSNRLASVKYVLLIPALLILLSAFSVNIVHVNIPINDVPSISPIAKSDITKTTVHFNQEFINPITKKKVVHSGVDLAAKKGTDVVATADGTISFAAEKGNHGNLIILNHGDYESFYSHLNDFNVSEGDVVKKGQVIAHVGSTGMSTGPHLHYEVRYKGERVDPEKYF